MRLNYIDDPDATARWVIDTRNLIARAATATMRDVAALGTQAGRAAIAAGGFSGKWQKALRNKVYPASGTSLTPATLVYSKIQYSKIFETGGGISGKPMLWLPIEANLPTSRGGRPWTPQRYTAQIGPLESVNVPGHPPLLFGVIRVRSRGSKPLSASRQNFLGAPGADRAKRLPLFVGVPTVNIPKKFDATAAIRAVGAQIPEIYDKHIAAG